MDTNETKQKAKLNGSLPADQMTKRELIAAEMVAALLSNKSWRNSIESHEDLGGRLTRDGATIARRLLEALEETN